MFPNPPITPWSRWSIFHHFSSSRRKPGSSAWDGCRQKFYGLDPGFRRDDGLREDLSMFLPGVFYRVIYDALPILWYGHIKLDGLGIFLRPLLSGL